MAASITKVSARAALPRSRGDGGLGTVWAGLQNRTDAGAREHVHPVGFGELPVDIVLFLSWE